jgi:hypothetical protein
MPHPFGACFLWYRSMRFFIPFVVLITCLLNPTILMGQADVPKSNLSLGIGLPTHPDMDVNENGLFLSLNYRRNFSKVFNWGVFFLRSSANSELDFFEDKQQMLEYLNSPDATIGLGLSPSKIETYALGGQLHVNFINRHRHFLSFSGGVGFYSSISSNQRLSEVTIDSLFTEDGEFISSSITDFEGEARSERKTELLIMPALNYQYLFKNNYFLGLEANLLLDMDSQELTQHPVLANFYSFNLHFGKRF